MGIIEKIKQAFAEEEKEVEQPIPEQKEEDPKVEENPKEEDSKVEEDPEEELKVEENPEEEEKVEEEQKIDYQKLYEDLKIANEETAKSYDAKFLAQQDLIDKLSDQVSNIVQSIEESKQFGAEPKANGQFGDGKTDYIRTMEKLYGSNWKRKLSN